MTGLVEGDVDIAALLPLKCPFQCGFSFGQTLKGLGLLPPPLMLLVSNPRGEGGIREGQRENEGGCFSALLALPPGCSVSAGLVDTAPGTRPSKK